MAHIGKWTRNFDCFLPKDTRSDTLQAVFSPQLGSFLGLEAEKSVILLVQVSSWPAEQRI